MGRVITALRRAVPADADAVAGVWLRSYAAALPTVRRARSDDAVRAWLRDAVEHRAVWVAEVAAEVVGVMVLGGNHLSQLYLDPLWRGHGIGDLFIELAKKERPQGLELWTFQVNAPARRFYARHGFVEVELTDGAANEEHEPDVRLRWEPTPG